MVSIMVKRFPVLINGKRYSPEFQGEEKFARSWRSVLESTYKNSHGICLCFGNGEKKLAIKHSANSDQFHLARFPETGADHSPDCRYYSPSLSMSGLQGYDLGVVDEGSDGSLRIKLAHGVRERQPGEHKPAPAETAISTGGRVRKPSMSLLGLLHLLWSESRLNTWYPAMDGKRTQWLVSNQILGAAERITTSRVSLADLLLVAAEKESKVATSNQFKVNTGVERGYRMLVVSQLARYNPDRDRSGEYLPLRGPYGIPRLKMTRERWEVLYKRFEREVAAWHEGDAVVAIAQVSLSGDTGYSAHVLDAALMRVSPRWIPVDSKHEADIEDRLYSESRSFNKPLRYDASEDCVFPDFWLLDTPSVPALPMEVYGMSTPEYLARKSDKRLWYAKRYGGNYWEWDVICGGEIPPFPLRKDKNAQ